MQKTWQSEQNDATKMHTKLEIKQGIQTKRSVDIV